MTRTFRMSSDTAYLTCDDCGKAQNLTAAEANAAGWVWVRCTGRDYCPECAS